MARLDTKITVLRRGALRDALNAQTHVWSVAGTFWGHVAAGGGEAVAGLERVATSMVTITARRSDVDLSPADRVRVRDLDHSVQSVSIERGVVTIVAVAIAPVMGV